MVHENVPYHLRVGWVFRDAYVGSFTCYLVVNLQN